LLRSILFLILVTLKLDDCVELFSWQLSLVSCEHASLEWDYLRVSSWWL
jgi:hypothetical protein